MTWFRHAGRHVQHTVMKYLQEQMAELDWMTEGSVPFGAALVQFTDQPAIIGDDLAKKVTPGLIAVTLGDERPSDMEEMGGPLAVQEYPVFVDIFQDTPASALSAATDVRDILMGRLEGTQRWLDLLNFAASPPTAVVGWKIELDDIERITPEHRFPVQWQVVKVTCSTYFPEVTY